MTDRTLRAIFMGWLGLFALIVAGDNIVNLEQAHGAVGYVLGQSENSIYPNSIFPALGSGPAWVVLAVICTAEIAVGLLCLYAFVKLWGARRDEAAFADALTLGKLGAACIAMTWLVLFWVFGVAGYVMWQTPVGQESAGSAFRISAFGFFVLLYLGQYRAKADA